MKRAQQLKLGSFFCISVSYFLKKSLIFLLFSYFYIFYGNIYNGFIYFIYINIKGDEL